MAAEQAPQRQKPKQPRIKTSDAILGAILVLLSLCGIVSLVHQGSVLAKRARESAAPEHAIAQELLPFALADTPAFDDPAALSDPDFLTLCAWSMIADDKLSGYPEQDGLRIVPAEDLIAAGNLRLGTAREPECKTIAFTEEIRFYYDEPKKSWILPDAPLWFGNLPQITEMHTENGVSTVTADYVPEQPAWSHSAPEPAAQAVFTVTESDGIRQITSLHFAEDAETDPTAETTTE